jgi:hypothetical protein
MRPGGAADSGHALRDQKWAIGGFAEQVLMLQLPVVGGEVTGSIRPHR